MALLYQASFFSTFAQGVLYGFALLLFLLTTWFLLGNRRRRRVNYPMLVASCTLMALSTAEMAVNIARIYVGVVTVGPTLAGGPDAYLGDNYHITFVLKNSLFAAQVLVLDAVVIYRAYVVWQNILVIIIPALGWCGLLVVSIATNLARAQRISADSIFAVDTDPWMASLYALDLGTNVTATSLLAIRIWTVLRKTAPQSQGSGDLVTVLRVAIESGALYSATMFVSLILFLVRSNGLYIMSDIASPIISIVFNMIFVRLGMAQERKARAYSTVIEQTGSQSSFVILSPKSVRGGNALPRAVSTFFPPDMEAGEVTGRVTDMYLNPESRRSSHHGGGGVQEVKSLDGRIMSVHGLAV
ncbi:hypothetical protein C8Q74DRAFT_1373547 [Fomes fomentarius]|nr:hypothetical protein C8Q74DRAFT_1373547 [Fomes fomentarius]